MPRKKNPDAKDVTMAARFSKAEADLIDAARGSIDRGPWIYAVVMAAAHQAADARIQDRLGIKIIADERMPPGVAALHTPGQPPQVIPVAGEPAGKDCPHPKGSRLKGRCTRCRTFVGYT